jgi:hypothetical protein
MLDGQSTQSPQTISAQRLSQPDANVKDYLALALKLERTIRQIQQSVLLLMCFGIAVSCMWYGDIEHMYVLGLFTICSYVLLRWGLPSR